MTCPRIARLLALPLLAAISGTAAGQEAPEPMAVTVPEPILYLTATEPYTANGREWIRYKYDVFNKDAYPAALFAAAPNLPPCGNNSNASRSWVDFFDSTGKRLYGFCSLGSPADLGQLWFATEAGVVPPSYVYVEINDRETGIKYQSNLAETVM